MSTRFELNEIRELDGILLVGITILRAISGSEVRVGGNYQWTNTVFSKTWGFKDGQLLAMKDRGEWVVYGDRNDETDFVLSALKSRGYILGDQGLEP